MITKVQGGKEKIVLKLSQKYYNDVHALIINGHCFLQKQIHTFPSMILSEEYVLHCFITQALYIKQEKIWWLSC